MTNYEFWWDGQPWGMDDIPIVGVFRDEAFRPSVGMEVRLKGGKIVRITRQSPANNPAGQKVTYYVENLNGNRPYRRNK